MAEQLKQETIELLISEFKKDRTHCNRTEAEFLREFLAWYIESKWC